MKRLYPEAPIPAVGVIVREGGRLLLIQRDKDPFTGAWSFPGGAIELGEPAEEAARREALEETGLVVELGAVAAVVDNVVRDAEGRVAYHYVIVDYYAQPAGGTLRPGSDVRDARWVRLQDLEGLDMPEVARKMAQQLLAGD